MFVRSLGGARGSRSPLPAPCSLPSALCSLQFGDRARLGRWQRRPRRCLCAQRGRRPEQPRRPALPTPHSLLFALCSLRSALCALPFALCPQVQCSMFGDRARIGRWQRRPRRCLCGSRGGPRSPLLAPCCLLFALCPSLFAPRLKVRARLHGLDFISGTGVPPVSSKPGTHGRDARVTRTRTGPRECSTRGCVELRASRPRSPIAHALAQPLL